MKENTISIIIPTLNEENELKRNLPGLRARWADQENEIIIVDGGSADDTVSIAESNNCDVIRSRKASRAIQMNAGARQASGDILFFIHADVLPPPGFDQHIKKSLENGSHFGMFAYRFEPSSLLLRINAFFTQFDGMFTGGGDQGLFIKKEIFEELGEFDEQMSLMEDFHFFEKAKQKYKYEILPQRMTVSSRKYQNNSYVKVQLVNLYTYLSYKRGVEVEQLAQRYRKWIR